MHKHDELADITVHYQVSCVVGEQSCTRSIPVKKL